MFRNIFSKRMAKKTAIGLGITLVLAAALITIKDEFFYQFFSYDNGSEGVASQDSGGCSESGNVALVKIHGSIVNYKLTPEEDPNSNYDPDSVASEAVVKNLDDIAKDDQIKGIIVEIDSSGGIPEAAEEIMNALLASTKPVAAYIRQSGDSAAYMIATAADKIYAGRMSDVGGIGVTMSYLDNAIKNKTDGLTYNQLSTGKFKDTGDPDKSLTAEEKSYLMSDLEKAHQVFVEFVAKNRNMDIDEVKKLADGSSMIAQDAKDAGLIDGIGGLNEAEAYLKGKIGSEVAACDYGK